MSTYYGTTRTNYFNVTDAEKLREILDACVIDDSDEIELWDRVDENGEVYYAFGCFSSIDGLKIEGESGDEDDFEIDFDAFAEALQKILPDGEVILIMESGHEKLCDVNGMVTVITNKEVKTQDFYEVGIDIGRKMLNDDKWRPKWW